MVAKRLDGKAIASQVRSEIAEKAIKFLAREGMKPHLAAVLVGDDPASQIYVKNKRLACEKTGLESSLHLLPATTSQSNLLETVERLNADPSVNGILVQFPLPKSCSEREVVLAIDPLKDVDAFHPYTVGLIVDGTPRFLPCTPAGIQQILIREKIETAGKEVVIVGRSHLVGRPLSIMLSQKGPHADATVTVCHSRTPNLEQHCRRADILIAAIGRPEAITGSMIKPGAVVIDVGINRLADGRVVGDVEFESAVQVASAITPVPGGVGPMTIAMLLENTLKAAALQHGEKFN
ncbi:bifunctional methylenetetrahydrofolate dehydrogenase/methenyltetrahydrofolate cyclohydrolase FolD [bacterium]|nr:bifunctional methylenetetrahydrofolate dehydrogenase/methenyltetrahydrofolate cyclohydrolase FolD [bacterium]